MSKYFKSLRLLVTALAIGCMGISTASAATEPEITPVPGSNVSNSLYSITLMWNGEEITRGDNWTNEANITITDGTTDGGYANYQMIDSEQNMIYDASIPGAGLRASFSFWVTPDEPGGAYILTLNIPDGLINIDGVPNEEMSLSYTIIAINDELIKTPDPTDKYSSLSSFSFKWAYYDAEINSDSSETITYSGDKQVESIVKQDDGFFLVNIGETITENGWISFNIPEGLCTLKTKFGDIPSPAGYIMYEIQQFSTIPSDWASFVGDFDRIIVTSDDIKLVGELNNILLVDSGIYDGSQGIISRGESCHETTTANGKNGLEIVFGEAYEGIGMVKVLIPGGTFQFNGNLYEQDITVNISVKQPLPAPNAIPADASKVKQLDLITLDWDNSPLYYTWDDTLKATLTVNDNDPIDISSNIKVLNDEEDSGFGWTIMTNGRIAVDFSENPYTEEGIYTINIPAGWVTVENYGYDMNADITLTYYVGAETAFMEEGTFETLFGNATTVPSIGSLTLTWDKQPIELIGSASATLVYNDEQTWTLNASIIELTDGEDGGIATGIKKIAAENENALVLIVEDDPFENPFISKPGKYVYNIPEGLVVNNNGEINPAQTITFTVAETTSTLPTINPETAIDGSTTAIVDELEQVTINWNNLSVELLDGSEIRIVNPQSEIINQIPSIIDNSLVFNLAEIAIEEGNYEIIIPEGAYIIHDESGDTLSQMIDLSYELKKVNSVKDITGNNGNVFNVYSIDGLHILTTENRSELESLSPGLYIINNQKVIIRK